MRVRPSIAIGAAVLAVAGCSASQAKAGNKAARQEQQAVAGGFQKMAAAQPVPIFDYSQLRQNLIEIQTAEANGIATTSFMFNLGAADPVHSCPSVGYPIPSSDQLTAPSQQVHNSDGNFVLPQGDPVGVYRGDTTGTYVICVSDSGTGYATLWEGYVLTVPGTAHWDQATHSLVNHPDGMDFSTSKDTAKAGG